MKGKDQIKAYDNMLKKHIASKNFVKINRTFNNKQESISGFLLDISTDFVLIQVVDDFLFDGFAIIRKDQFDSLRANKYDRASKRILKLEGLFDSNYGMDFTVDLNNWNTIFKSIKKQDHHVIIECEDFEDPLFEIGPLKRIGKNHVSVQYYDPTGLLENKLTNVKYKDITIVKFGDRYSITFKKYLRSR